MTCRPLPICLAATALAFFVAVALPGDIGVARSSELASNAGAKSIALPTVEEAGARAALLHATFDGVLRIMHRDFFRKGGTKAIPSESLKDVFKSLDDEMGVTLRWLASEETIMNVDNKARDAFDQKALKAVQSGERELHVVENGTFRYAGVIVLQNECLKCHVPGRTSLEDRYAALEISLPVKPETVPAK